jgi:hypothetical protein
MLSPHHPAQHTPSGLFCQSLATSEFEFVTYLGAYIGHTLYAGSEILSMNAMTTLVKGHTPLEAIDKIYKDTTEVSAWLSLFVTGFMNVMIKRYLSPLSEEQIETLSIEAEPPISNYTLSFFSSPPLPRKSRTVS